MSSFSLLHLSFFNKTSIDGLILTLRKNNILASSLKIVANLNDGRRAALRVKITKHRKMKVMQSSIDCRKKCAISLICITSPCYWSKKPIKGLIKTNHDLLTRVFARLKLFAYFYLSSHWLLVIFFFHLIGHCDYFGFGFMTLSRKAL